MSTAPRFNVNCQASAIVIEPHDLRDVLREELALTGTKNACPNIAGLPFFCQDHECGREHENDREHRKRIAKAQDQRLPSNDLPESDKSLMVCCSRVDAAMRREVAGQMRDAIAHGFHEQRHRASDDVRLILFPLGHDRGENGSAERAAQVAHHVEHTGRGQLSWQTASETRGGTGGAQSYRRGRHSSHRVHRADPKPLQEEGSSKSSGRHSVYRTRSAK